MRPGSAAGALGGAAEVDEARFDLATKVAFPKVVDGDEVLLVSLDGRVALVEPEAKEVVVLVDDLVEQLMILVVGQRGLDVPAEKARDVGKAAWVMNAVASKGGRRERENRMKFALREEDLAAGCEVRHLAFLEVLDGVEKPRLVAAMALGGEIEVGWRGWPGEDDLLAET